MLIEQIDEAKSITQLLAALERNDLVTRRVDIGTGVVSLSQGEGSLEFRMTDVEVCKTLGPAWQMLIVGDGQLARHLTSMAHQFDYGVTICDPREHYHVNRKTGRSAVHARDA